MTSKFGWSLPPGCTTLPGEGADEQMAEAQADAVYSALELAGYAPDDKADRACALLMKLLGEAYGAGYKDGMADEAMAQEFNRRPAEDT
jgi:hypothetical protein